MQFNIQAHVRGAGGKTERNQFVTCGVNLAITEAISFKLLTRNSRYQRETTFNTISVLSEEAGAVSHNHSRRKL